MSSDFQPHANSGAEGRDQTLPFQVDIAGVIQLMGESLYSRPETAVRELIQNAHDGILRRRHIDLQFQGRIHIVQNPQQNILQVTDDGIGLSWEEAEKYLGTLGTGITGLLKRQIDGPRAKVASQYIGQFGIGLFSAFLIADRITVETCRADGTQPLRWEAGLGTDIHMRSCQREEVGTTVTLQLKPEYADFASDPKRIEGAVREYANFLPIPIHLNDRPQRINVVGAPWLDMTPDREAIELELESYFDETPLELIPVRIEKPITIQGVLYVTPQRTPGFTDVPVLTVTVRRMVISRRLQGLLPPWASFVRGIVELPECAPTTSREDLVRNREFFLVQAELDRLLYEHLERLADEEPDRFQAILAWHRYLLAGVALEHHRLRHLLRRTYHFNTSQGDLTFEEILKRSKADPLFGDDMDYVVWYNVNRRQEAWINGLFANHPGPCVHLLRSFEETLLAFMVDDVVDEGVAVEMRLATPSEPSFSRSIVGMRDLEEAPPAWQDFLGDHQVQVMVAEFDPEQPVLAFLSERIELQKTFEELKQRGQIPSGFQRLIDQHFDDDNGMRPNEVVLNRNHSLVARALEQRPGTPLSCVLRLLVHKSLSSLGMTLEPSAQLKLDDDLRWIAEALWGRSDG